MILSSVPLSTTPRWARAILHVDMDAFFASVEELDAPTLRGQPVLVGVRGRRGVVAAASYAARKFGCRSAMPMVQALRLCPDAHVVPPRHARYAEVSAQVSDIFRDFTPLVEGLSLDEAFLDVTASQSLLGTPVAMAEAIRARIEREIGITASAGVASSKFVAKIASDDNKPNGISIVAPGTEAAYLSSKPIGRMWGVGAKTEAHLQACNVRTFADLLALDAKSVQIVLGNSGAAMQALARGDDHREVESDHEAKSIGAEETFSYDIHDAVALRPYLLGQAEDVAARMYRSDVRARTVQLKLKYSDFTLITRRKTIAGGVADADSIFDCTKALLQALPLARGVRLIGTSVSNLRPRSEGEPQPQSLFDETPSQASAKASKRSKVEAVNDALQSKLGVRLVRADTLVRGVAPNRDPSSRKS